MKNPFRAKTAADYGAEIARLEAGAHDREHAISVADKALRTAIVDGEPSDIAKAEKAISEARKASEYAAMRLEGLRERQATLAAAEDQAARRTAYDRATKAAEDGKTSLRTIYRRMAADRAQVLKIVRDAQELIDRANANLPEGAEPIVDPDSALRSVPRVDEEIVSERTVSAWCHYRTWHRIPENCHVFAGSRGDPNLGEAQAPGGPLHNVERRAFRIVRFRPAIHTAWAPPLDQALSVPALAEDQPDYERPIQERWEPIRDAAADAA